MHDRKGQRFGRLLVERDSGERSAGGIMWRCVGDCGNRKNISQSDLRAGKTKSCGCLRIEAITKHGASPRSGRTPTYASWNAMLARCRAKSGRLHRFYGNVSVCERWESFEAFAEDMGERPSRAHSIDRIDGTKGYEKGNCRWATKTQQVQNMKSNVNTHFRGEDLCLAEIARRCSVPARTVAWRYKQGARGEDLVTRAR